MEEEKRFSMMLGWQPELEKKSLKELQSDSRNLGIDTMKHFSHRVSPGYLGRGKGYVQLLWERGFNDVKIMKDYVIRKEDSDGVLVPELSLLHMMESCSDFASEVSQLEHVSESLGSKVIITTNYHAEYAGEGVEYSWGFS